MAYKPGLQQLQPANTAVIRVTVPMSGIADALGSIFGEVIGYVSRTDAGPALQAFARHTFHEGGLIDIEAGFTTTGPVTPSGRIEAGSLPGGEAVTYLHVGPYDQVGAAYEAITDWTREAGREQAGTPWEVYLSMPDEDPPRTLVVCPLKPIEVKEPIVNSAFSPSSSWLD